MNVRLLRGPAVLLLTLGLLVPARAGRAQSTAADPQRPDKPKTETPASEPPDRNRIELIREYAEDKGITDLFGGEGFYLRFSGLTPGGGVSVAPGYRHTFAASSWRFDTIGAISWRGYQAFRGGLWWRPLASDRLEVGGNLHYRDFNGEDFFGIGPDSRREDRTSFSLRSVEPFASVTWRPHRSIELGARTGPRRDRLRPGEDDEYPSVEERFTDRTVPALGQALRFLYTEAHATFDMRDRRHHRPLGGAYAVSIERFTDRDGGLFSTTRLIGEVSQDVPLAGPRHVLVLHALSSTAFADAGARVPVHLMPMIGGSDTLRGFHSRRFHDGRAVVVNAEYRYQPVSHVELAAFVDGGTVGARWSDLALGRFKRSYGVGVRGIAERRAMFRLDVGTGGGEGVRAMVRFGPAF